MKARYHIDLKNYDLGKFMKSLQRRDMIPSRLILKDDIEKRFGILDSHGIQHVKALIETLNTKQRIEQFSKKTALPIDYLTVLRREASSYLPNPILLKKFPGIDPKDVAALEDLGIRNTKQFFTKMIDGIEPLSKSSGLSAKTLHELAALSDLSRLYGVGPVFARIIFDVGIKSVKSFLNHKPEEFIEIYENKMKKKADFSVTDIQFSMELANELQAV